MAEYIIDKIAYNGNVYKLQDNQSGYITTDENLKWTASTSSDTYYPLQSTSTATTSTANTLNGINFYQYYNTAGGYRRLNLGNSTAWTSTGGAYGTIRLYGAGATYYGDLVPGVLGTTSGDGHISANRTWTLPDKTGTIALTSDIPSNNVTGSGFSDRLAVWSGTKTLSSTVITTSSSYDNNSGSGTVNLYMGCMGQIYYKGQLVFYNGNSSNTITITPSNLTGFRTLTLPDKTGTIALTSDVPSISLNGSSTTSASFYAPTSAGTSGYYLKSNGSGAPTWATIPAGVTVTLNGSTTTTPSFYAPTSAGTSGQVLISNGSGAPTWTNAGSSTDEKLAVSEVSTNGTYYPIFGTGTAAATRQYDTTGFSYYEYNGTTSVTGSSRIILGNNTPAHTAGNKIGSIQIYGETAYSYTIAASALGPLANRTLTLPDKTGTIALTSDIPTVPTITLNGSSTTSPSFYAPTSAGTSGQVLTSNGSGAPTWAAATGGTSAQIIRWTES